MSDYQTFRVVYEICSAILCFILVRFMIKPYSYTKESRYIGLPLAFALLGASYFFSAVTYGLPSYFHVNALWIQLVLRTFAFVFLAATYHFSNLSKASQLIRNVTFSLISVAVLTSVVIVIFLPQISYANYLAASEYFHIFNIICLIYIIIRVLRSHMAKPDPTTLMTPLGYILFAIGQYSLIIYAVDKSMLAWWGALALRWGGLAIFLYVAYVTFYGAREKGQK
jgi:hypothetical protein